MHLAARGAGRRSARSAPSRSARRVDVLVHEALDLLLQQLHLVGRFEVHGGSWVSGCRTQGRTLTLTAPAFLSAASAKPRSTSASGTRWVSRRASALALGGDAGAPPRAKSRLAGRARVAVRPGERGLLEEQQRAGRAATGAEEEAEHRRRCRPAGSRRPRAAACRRCRPTVSTTRSIGASRASCRSAARRRPPPRAARAPRRAPRASSAWCGWRALTSTSPAPSARAASAAEQADGAGAEHEHALPGAQPAAAQAVHHHRHRLGERGDARVEIGGHREGAAAPARTRTRRGRRRVDAEDAAARRRRSGCPARHSSHAPQVWKRLDRDAVAHREAGDAVAERVDLAGHLVAGRRAGRPEAGVEEVQVAAADAAGEHAHAHLARPRLGNRNRRSRCSSRPRACAASIVAAMPGRVAAALSRHGLAETLHHRAHHQRPGDGRVGGHLGEAAALALGHELPPGHALGVAAAREPAPVIGLGADAHGVLVAAHRLVDAAGACAGSRGTGPPAAPSCAARRRRS